jgi:hypothetical protein
MKYDFDFEGGVGAGEWNEMLGEHLGAGNVF